VDVLNKWGEAMSRLIDADALIAWIKGSQQMTSKMKCVIAKIETMPTIDAVSVVQGEWIDQHENGHGFWVGVCNQCGKEKRLDNYCSNCGARMKGADDE
jgi:hypothetical protein